MDTTITTPKPFAFVLMPFDPTFKDTYELGIKAACSEAGGYCERVDEQFYENSIVERIYNQIAKADLVIADMTGRNPNVFYEVGYAHALGKQVILLTQKSEDIPFDLKHYAHIVYGGRITELKSDLEKRLRWAFENPQKSLELSRTQLGFFIGSLKILGEPTIKVTGGGSGVLSFGLDINNLTEKTIIVAYFQLGLQTSHSVTEVFASPIEEMDNRSNYKIKLIRRETNRVYIVDHHFKILPGSWEKVFFTIVMENGFKEGNFERLILTEYSEAGPQDYPFKIALIGP